MSINRPTFIGIGVTVRVFIIYRITGNSEKPVSLFAVGKKQKGDFYEE